MVGYIGDGTIGGEQAVSNSDDCYECSVSYSFSLMILESLFGTTCKYANKCFYAKLIIGL
jgi:hypothetical protein